jgi:hypothetical protein
MLAQYSAVETHRLDTQETIWEHLAAGHSARGSLVFLQHAPKPGLLSFRFAAWYNKGGTTEVNQ